MPKVKKIAVIIPCYNEAVTIGDVIDGFSKSLPEAKIFVYDNNSTDGTDSVAKKHKAIVRYEKMQGKSNVVRAMFREIDADVYLLVDGDNSYPANKAREMIKPIIEGTADMVLGDRLSLDYAKQNSRFGHVAGNRLIKRIINKIFSANIHDAMTGYRAFSRRFVKSFAILSGGFELETEMTIFALNHKFRIHQLPVRYQKRLKGSNSKLRTVPDGCKILLLIFNMVREYKPLLFFGLWALPAFIIGLIGAIVPVIEYLNTGLVLRFPTLIVGVTFLAISLILISIGLISDLIVRKNQRMFEIMLNILAGLPS
ncbi:MAG: glycosyltransferase family 2 protein [Candidatus Nomurabacteria bacterium]|jgi:glycosyltransferase involved in cell wall biosynthesis|nr:glycosyltransferase family 2 protein [Candidatus Nomurabacteria bacterium]